MNFTICDDNPKEVALIRLILKEHFKGCSIDEFNNGSSLIKHLEDNSPDIVFLDVEMPGLNGLETAKVIRLSHPNIGIIFITGHSHYALNAFEVYAFDFIVKPVNKERLVSSVEMILKRTAEDESFIEIKNRGTIFRVDQNEILFVEKNYNKCFVHTSRFVYTMSTTLKYFTARLDPEIFIKTHSGFIVNRTKIVSLTPKGSLAYEIHFDDTGKKACLSRGMRDKLNLILGKEKP